MNEVDKLDRVLDIFDPDNYISIDENPNILPNQETPETLYIKNHLFDDISNEVKEVMEILLNGPTEFTHLMFNQWGHASYTTITRFLKSIGWKNKKINDCMKDMQKMDRICRQQ